MGFLSFCLKKKALNVQLLVTVSIALVASSKDKWLISLRGEGERKFFFVEKIRERDVFLSWHSSFSWVGNFRSVMIH